MPKIRPAKISLDSFLTLWAAKLVRVTPVVKNKAHMFQKVGLFYVLTSLSLDSGNGHWCAHYSATFLLAFFGLILVIILSALAYCIWLREERGQGNS
jgi:hypothetical protein